MYVLPYLIFEEFLIAVAFRLWVLRGTSSSVEYEEVCVFYLLNYSAHNWQSWQLNRLLHDVLSIPPYTTICRFRCLSFSSVSTTLWFIEKITQNPLYPLSIARTLPLQFDSLGMSILNESGLHLSDDAVEQIVDQVHHIQIKCCCARSLKAIHMFMLNYIPTDIQGGRLEQHWEDRSWRMESVRK